MSRNAILLALIIFCLPSFALAEIGRIKRAYGDASIEREGKTIAAIAGETIEQSDILVTGSDGRITVTFIDNSRFSTGADSRINLETFEFDEKTYEGKFIVSVEKGTIAIVSGQIATQRPDAMRIKTPTSVLGVRGTRFIVQVQPVLVLLPSEPGAEKKETGALALFDADGGERAVVKDAYAIAKMGTSDLHSTNTDKKSVDAEHSALLDNMPKPPKSYNLYFDTGKKTPNASSKAALDALLKDVGTREHADVQVIGHTDTQGTADSNDTLSKFRADEVKKFLLVELNDTPARIRTSGRGERELLKQTKDGIKEPLNRRVQVIVR